MMKQRGGIVLCVLVLAASVAWWMPSTSADVGDKKTQPDVGDKKTQPKDKKADKPSAAATIKAEKKNFRVEVTVKGTLEAAEMGEIAYRAQPVLGASPLPLIIEKIAEHGSAVKAGDRLVAFEMTRMDQAMRDLEVEKNLLDANIQLAAREQPLLEKSVPVDLTIAQREKKQADEDLKYFLDVGKAQMVKRIDFQLKMYAEFYDSAKEELRQLEKMYKSNDLTEETEQIVLRRYRRYLESADFMYKEAKLEHEHALKVELPRREISVKQNALKSAMHLERVQQTSELGVLQKRQMLQRMYHDRGKLEDRIAKLHKDRAQMTITAPFDGIVYHGRFSKGQWTGGASERLVPHGTVQPEDVFMTVLKTSAMCLRILVEEKDAGDLKAGLAGKARFTFAPNLKLDAKVARIASVPSSTGKFETLVDIVADAARAEAIKPGMACAVKFVAYANKDAVTVPAGAVSEEDDKHIVYVPDGKNKPKMREVTVGRTSDGVTEILKGLRDGEEILPERPRPVTAAATSKGEE